MDKNMFGSEADVSEFRYNNVHWRRLVKNYWVGKKKYWGEKVVKGDKCMGDSKLLGARVQAGPPKSTPMIIVCVLCFV